MKISAKYPTTRAGRLERSLMKKQRIIERINMDIKECSLCKIYLPLDKFRIRIKHGVPYTIARCRKCDQEMSKIQCNKENRRSRQRKSSNPELYKKKYEKSRKWLESKGPEYKKNLYHKDLEKSRSYGAKYRDANREKVRIRCRNRARKYRDNISSQYVKNLLTKRSELKTKDVPASLIEVKSLYIICKRTLKQKEHESQRIAQSDV